MRIRPLQSTPRESALGEATLNTGRRSAFPQIEPAAERSTSFASRFWTALSTAVFSKPILPEGADGDRSLCREMVWAKRTPASETEAERQSSPLVG